VKNVQAELLEEAESESHNLLKVEKEDEKSAMESVESEEEENAASDVNKEGSMALTKSGLVDLVRKVGPQFLGNLKELSEESSNCITSAHTKDQLCQNQTAV